MTKDELYESETHEHIHQVQMRLGTVLVNLAERQARHDASKLEEPERSGFQQMAEELKLSETTYGSEEYRAILRKYKPSAIGHHYEHNDHHPEYHETHAAKMATIPAYAVDAQGRYDAVKSGKCISQMTLLSLLEMICDWDAAGLRHPDSTFAESLRINRERFGIDAQLHSILYNTALELGFIT